MNKKSSRSRESVEYRPNPYQSPDFDRALEWFNNGREMVGIDDPRFSQTLICYSSNNSGGRWWLGDEDWIRLASKGWRVWWAEWYQIFTNTGILSDSSGTPLFLPPTPEIREWIGTLGRNDYFNRINDSRMNEVLGSNDIKYLGAIATNAYRLGHSEGMAIAEFEDITDQKESTQGCPCCGPPHGFYLEREGR